MEQTFADLLQERTENGKGVLVFALWMFIETFVATMKENRSILRLAVATAFILLLPLLAMQFTDEVVWGPGDFVVAGALLFGAGLTYELIAARSSHVVYRAASGVAVAAALLLVWVNLAVGIIGEEGNPANLMYVGVLAVGITGALIARFRPRGMARALLATALAQMLVAVIAAIAGQGSTFILNGFFAALWIASSLLFRRAGASHYTLNRRP